MRQGDLTSGPARLYKSWQKLNAQWEQAKQHWHDGVSQQFEEKYLVEWDPQIMTTLERMRALAGMLHSAEQQCSE